MNSLQIRCSGSTDFNTDRPTEWTLFGLWWTLERRITKILRQIYHKLQKNYRALYNEIEAVLQSTTEKVKELIEILELTPLHVGLVEFALEKSHNDEVS